MSASTPTEIVVGGSATGRLLALQIKSGESYFHEPVPDGFVYRGDSEHLEYWLNHTLPVVVVICNPLFQEAYWQVIAEETIEKTSRGALGSGLSLDFIAFNFE
jgi:Domain of unknown function (DUF4365)